MPGMQKESAYVVRATQADPMKSQPGASQRAWRQGEGADEAAAGTNLKKICEERGANWKNKIDPQSSKGAT